jgi:microcystin-dependent protein
MGEPPVDADKFIIKRLSRRALLSFVGIFSLIPLTAKAACSNPFGSTGNTQTTTNGTLLVCDGTNWNPVIFPSGAIIPFAGSTAPVSGWLLCYGQAVSRSTYANLFAAISTTYGSGDGSTTFNLPDLRGRAPHGVDNMGGTAASRVTSGGSGITGTTLGATGGAETVTLTTAQLPSHNHSASDSGHSHSISDPGHSHGFPNNLFGLGNGPFLDQGNNGAAAYGGTNGSGTGIGINTGYASISIGNTGSGNTHNNMTPTIMLNYIIKT